MKCSYILVFIATIVTSIHTVSNSSVFNSDVNLKNSSIVSTSNQTSDNSTEPLTINANSIEDICLAIGIPLEECACELSPDLCAVETSLDTGKEILIFFPTVNLVLAIISTVCLFLGIVGNSAVLSVSVIDRKNLVKSQKLITQMAFVDLMCCLMVFLSSVHFYWTDKWVFGLTMCKLVSALVALGTFLPVGYMLIIAIERYTGIIHPLKKNIRGGKATYIYIGLNAVIGIGSVIPLAFAFQISNLGVCEEKWSGGRNGELIYNWFLVLFYFAVPIAITGILYGIIMRHLSLQLRSNTAVNREDIKHKRLKSNRRIMIILISLLVAFVVCVLPTRVTFLYLAYTMKGGKRMVTSMTALKVISYVNNLTLPLHTVVNPIIYSIIDDSWRRKLLTMLGFTRSTNVHSQSTQRSYTSTKRSSEVSRV